MISYEKVASRIFNILKGHGFNIKMYSEDGMQTTDPELSRRFFVNEPNIMVTLQDDNDEIKMNKNANLGLEEVRSIILQLRMLSEEFMLKFTLRVFGHDIVPRDYAYDAENGKDETMEGIQEASLSRMFGGKKTSYQTLENVKMIIRHKVAVNEEHRGARARNISAIFLECNGERFQFPYNNLQGGRAMARHLSMGGAVDDMMGEHIVNTTGNIAKLTEFVHYTKSNKLVNESSKHIVDSITENLSFLKNDLKRMSGVKTYESIKRRVEENKTVGLSEDDMSELKDIFTVKRFDERMDEVLPIVSRIVQEKEQYLRRIEESSASVLLVPQMESSVNNILEFKNKNSRFAHKISEMSRRVYGNEELAEYLNLISRKLCNESELSVFERSILKNVLENAQIHNAKANEPSEILECKSIERFFDKYNTLFI